MPRGQNRQTNAHSRALETISNTIVADPQEEPTEVTPTATVLNLPQQQPAQETAEDQQPKKKPAAKQQNNRLYWDKVGGEDFFEYLNSISQEERSGARLKFYTVNQDGSVGGVVHQIVGGWEDVDESWMMEQPNLGAGKYKVELRNSAKSGRKNEYNFLQIGSDEEIRKQSLRKQGLRNEGGGEVTSELHGAKKGIDAFATATEKGMDFLEKSYEKAIERAQTGSDPVQMAKAMAELMKPAAPTIDIPALITSIVQLIPKNNDQSQVVVQMMQAQMAQMQAQSQAFITMLQTQAQQALQAAQAQATQMLESQKQTFQLVLAEKEKKEEDTFGSKDVLKGLFHAFAQKINVDEMGETQLPGWAGVAQSFLPKLAEAIPAFMAARNGATPQQIAQIQEQQRLQAAQLETAHGANGGLRQQNPAEPKLITTEDMLNSFIDRLGAYLALMLQKQRPADPEYMKDVMWEEFEPVYDLFYHNQPDAIMQAVHNAQFGQQLLTQIPIATAFIDELIKEVKKPDKEGDEEDEEPEIILATPEQATPQPKRKGKSAH